MTRTYTYGQPIHWDCPECCQPYLTLELEWGTTVDYGDYATSGSLIINAEDVLGKYYTKAGEGKFRLEYSYGKNPARFYFSDGTHVFNIHIYSDGSLYFSSSSIQFTPTLPSGLPTDDPSTWQGVELNTGTATAYYPDFSNPPYEGSVPLVPVVNFNWFYDCDFRNVAPNKFSSEFTLSETNRSVSVMSNNGTFRNNSTFGRIHNYASYGFCFPVTFLNKVMHVEECGREPYTQPEYWGGDALRYDVVPIAYGTLTFYGSLSDIGVNP